MLSPASHGRRARRLTTLLALLLGAVMLVLASVSVQAARPIASAQYPPGVAFGVHDE